MPPDMSRVTVSFISWEAAMFVVKDALVFQFAGTVSMKLAKPGKILITMVSDWFVRRNGVSAMFVRLRFWLIFNIKFVASQFTPKLVVSGVRAMTSFVSEPCKTTPVEFAFVPARICTMEAPTGSLRFGPAFAADRLL